MNTNEIIKIGEDVYQIRYYWLSQADVYMYLIIGKDRALLIDTGYVTTHAKQFAESVTSLPLIAVNTHGHFDHIGGNSQFETVFISGTDRQLALNNSKHTYLSSKMEHAMAVKPEIRDLLSDPSIKKDYEVFLSSVYPDNYSDLPEEGFFDLGGRRVSFFPCPGHTRGSISLFDPVTGYLFCGDTVCEEKVLLGFDESTSVQVFLQTLYDMQAKCSAWNVKSLYPGHHKTPVDFSIISDYIHLCEEGLNGRLKSDYVDTGTCQGQCFSDFGVKIIFKTLK